jgi:hypothetical protein
MIRQSRNGTDRIWKFRSNEAGPAYFVRDRGRVSGPFDEATLIRFARTRRIARHHQVSTNGTDWVAASTALPSLFLQSQFKPAVPELILPDAAKSNDSDDRPMISEPVQRIGAAPQGRGVLFIAAASGLASLVLVAAGVWVTLSLRQSQPWTEDRLRDEGSECLVVVQGIKGSKGPQRLLGIPVSRSHLVMPAEAAELAMIKVEAGDATDRKWRGMLLQLVDLQTGLAGGRADLGRGQGFFDITPDPEKPRIDETLYIVGTAGDEPIVLSAKLSAMRNEGGPDERMVVKLNRDPPADILVLGAAVLDRFGRLVGMVTARPSEQLVACTPAHEIHNKKQELKRIPSDHSIEPITLPQPPEAPLPEIGPTQPPVTQPPVTQPPVTQPPVTQPPVTQPPVTQPPVTQPPVTQPPVTQPPDPPGGGSSATDLVDTLGGLAERTLNDASDSELPPLDKETANRLGRETLDEILAEHPRCNDKAAVLRVRDLFHEMAIAADMKPASLTLTVTEDPDNNAYSFVGRHLVVTTGFLQFAGTDDDMIRFVLAHELGHIALGHTDLPYRRREAAGEAGAMIHGLGEQLIGMSPISQAQERDADCFAVRALRRTGRSAEGGVRFFKRVDSAESRPEDQSPLLGALFGSHPDNQRRIAHIRQGCSEPPD